MLQQFDYPIDNEFPPNKESLGSEKFTWESYHGYPLFKDMKDYPKQGKLGNCYWISPVVAVLARDPEQIQSLFVQHDQNFTTVRLCVDGEWLLVTVDHYFPYNQAKGWAAYCKPLSGAIWAMVLEKAWAKIFGSYKKICGGFNRTTLRILTGASPNKYRTKDPYFDKLMEEVILYKFPMCCNSRKQQASNEFAKNHAYSLLKIENGVVTVRNPWGLKNSCIKQLKLEDFREKFASVEVCHYFKGYNYYSERVRSEFGETKQFKIEILKQGNYFFSLNQKNKRYFRGQKDVNYNISPSEIALWQEEQIILNREKRKSTKDLWINWHFSSPTTVYVGCQVLWDNQQAQEFVFSVYGPQCVVSKSILVYDINNMIEQADIKPRFILRDYDQEQNLEEMLLQNQIGEVEQGQEGTQPQNEKDRSCSGTWNILQKCVIF